MLIASLIFCMLLLLLLFARVVIVTRSACDRLNDTVCSYDDLLTMKRVIELNMRLAIPIGILFLSFIGESFACAVVFLAPLVILFAVTFVSVIVCVIVRNERRCHAMRVAGPPEINIIFQRWLKQWKQPRFSLTDPENILNKLPYLPSAQSETIWPPPPKIDG